MISFLHDDLQKRNLMRDLLLKQDKIRENKLMITLVTDLKIPCISDVSRLKQRIMEVATENNFREICLK